MAAAESVPDIVHAWFRARLAAGAVARDTDAYNQVVAALPDLLGRLGATVGTVPAAPAATAPRDAPPAAADAPSA